MTLQTKWRIYGGIAITCCGFMAWYGTTPEMLRQSPIELILYWALFLILFAGAVFIAFLDLRYVRLQHALEKRAAFLNTLGDPSFRKALRAGREEPLQQDGEGEEPE